MYDVVLKGGNIVDGTKAKAYKADIGIKLGGYYFTHWKRTGVRIGTPEPPNKLSGIIEALDIALNTGIKTEISHLSTGFDIYPDSPEMDRYAAEVTTGIIDKYINMGADVAFDVIPGISGGICINPYLASYFTPWIKQSGGLEGLLIILKLGTIGASLQSLLKTVSGIVLIQKPIPSGVKKLL